MKNIIFLSVLLCNHPLYAQSTNSTDLAGEYEMQLQIGDKTFLDQMILSSPEGSIGLGAKVTSLTRSITVPGAFSAELTGSSSCRSFWSGPSCQINFEITAKENGQSFKVYYEATLNSEDYINVLTGQAPPIFRGSAYLEEHQLLGNFVAKKK